MQKRSYSIIILCKKEMKEERIKIIHPKYIQVSVSSLTLLTLGAHAQRGLQ